LFHKDLENHQGEEIENVRTKSGDSSLPSNEAKGEDKTPDESAMEVQADVHSSGANAIKKSSSLTLRQSVF
jgi:hypothetical protein